MSLAALHPAERRRTRQAMPPEPHHDVLLRPLGGGDARTIITTSAARSFVEQLFEDLAAADWRARLADMRGVRRNRDGLLELGLPTHRKFQLALFEAVCVQPGSPRLDPAKIESQGMVLRRQRRGWAGWMSRGKTMLGWAPIGLTDADPDPARREGGHAGNRAARSLIAARAAVAPAEEEIPLYLAPAEVCAARGRTILFGVIPVLSGDQADTPADPIDYAALDGDDRVGMEGHLSEYLKARPPLDMPRAGEVLTADWNVIDAPADDSVEAARLSLFGIFLHQLATELDAFARGAPAPAALRKVLAEIELPLDGGGRTDAASFLAKAAPILLDREGNPGGVRMPLAWPRIGDGLGTRLTLAALDCLTARHAALAQAPGKFDVQSDRYAVRGFIRVRGPAGCPAKLVWSAYSEPFRILPWWDGDGPGVKISLPDLSQVKSLKPNVAFEMPPAIANLLKGDPKKLSEGEGSTAGVQIAWLCSFSLPIITLCAFIVLNIFLSLFDLIFRWMLYIKICIPIPLPKKG